MTPAEYKQERQRLSLTQAALADRLEVSRPTIARRESGNGKITEEAALAIRQLLSSQNAQIGQSDKQPTT